MQDQRVKHLKVSQSAREYTRKNLVNYFKHDRKMQTRNHQELWDIPGKFHVSENKTIWQLAVGNRGVDAYSKNTNRVTGETN